MWPPTVTTVTATDGENFIQLESQRELKGESGGRAIAENRTETARTGMTHVGQGMLCSLSVWSDGASGLYAVEDPKEGGELMKIL